MTRSLFGSPRLQLSRRDIIQQRAMRFFVDQEKATATRVDFLRLMMLIRIRIEADICV